MTDYVQKKVLGFSDSSSVFAAQWQNPVFFNLMLKLSGVSNPHIYYIGAAAGDDPKRINDFLDIAKRCTCHTTVFRLFNMSSDSIDDYFKDADIIFIDGGVTRNLLALLNEWDVIPALRRAYETGVLLAGASAGISMLFDWCITDSIKTRIQAIQGIGLLAGTVCVHYDVREDRQHVLNNLLQCDKPPLPAFGLCDGTAVLFENDVLSQAFSIKPDVSVFEFVGSGQRIDHIPKYLDDTKSSLPQDNSE